MQKDKKIKIEYIILAIIFASVVWSIFAGFRVARYQWILIIISFLLSIGISLLSDRYQYIAYMLILACGIFVCVFHSQLLNGFRIINNKMALALNQSMDLGFYYYISVQMEYSRRDSVLAVICFLLIVMILLSFLKNRPFVLFLITGFMECAVLLIAPYNVSGIFLLFLGSWIAYFSLSRGKKGFGIVIYAICFLLMLPLYFHDQTSVPSDTLLKRNILVQVRKMTQGTSYLAVGGLGNGDIGSVGEVSPTGEKLFKVYAPEKEDLYLKGYVSGTYRDGKWINEKKDTLVYGGESAIELPYLFSDLHMEDFIRYRKGYIKTEKDDLFSEKRSLKIQYQKKQDENLLFPYFCDTSQIQGNIMSDRMIIRNTGQKDYDMTYYQIKILKNILSARDNLDFSTVFNQKQNFMEQDYVRTMDDYDSYVKKNYLEIPDNIKKYLSESKNQTGTDIKKTILENVEAVTSYLKDNYEYTYRPGLTLQGKDPVLYFLKDRKKGFCTQYASAAVFFFRNVKIPARYVEGYKIRSDQWKLGQAQVTDYEAHAWVEIYLDHIGWVPIDVTGRNTGEKTYVKVEKEEKQKNAIVPNRKQFVINVKKFVKIMFLLLAMILFVTITKMLQKKKRFLKLTNRQKVLYYEKEMLKYGEDIEKPTKTADRMTFQIVEKAKFSQKDLTKQEVRIVKRHLDLLKKKNKNITKILSRVK